MNGLDVIPADDLGLRRRVSRYYRDDRRIPGEIARKRGDWRGSAGFYLVIAGGLG